jgi:pimeloyl-ACP methyl ester carboxylesterase
MMTSIHPIKTQFPSCQSVAVSAGSIEYLEFGAADAPPLLFIHGVLANELLWVQVAGRLAVNYRCIVPTWPLGAHRLAMHPHADLSPLGMVTVICEFMDALKLPKATLVGNDTGGALCQLMVQQQPQRISRLVLTSCDAYDNFLPLMFKYLEFSAFIPGLLWLLGQTMRMRCLRQLPFAFGRLAKRMPQGVSDALALPMANSYGVRRDVAKILRTISPKLTQRASLSFASFGAPVLIAWSREDRFFPIAHALQLQADFPNAQLVLIDDAYTFVGIDNPTQLANVIKNFLENSV